MLKLKARYYRWFPAEKHLGHAEETLMLRAMFILVHALLASYFVKMGADAYATALPAWDAGVIPIFCAFWFLFAALSFYLRNAWMVTMFTFAMGGISLLYLFIGGITELSMYGEAADVGGATMPIVSAFFLFLVSGQVYAMVTARKTKNGPGAG